MARNILSCNLNSYGKFREGAYEHLQQLGVRHVEIGAPSAAETPGVAAALERSGLTATSVAARCNVGDDSGIAAFAEPIAGAQALGAKLLFVSVRAGEIPRSDVFRRLRAMGDLAGERGLTIAIETHPDLAHNGDVALETMGAIRHPHVRINYDTGNVYYYNEGVDGVAELDKIAEHVASAHLKDTNGGFKTWNFPALGEGVCDFPASFRLLNARGFYGPFTLELEGIQGENLDEAGARRRVEESVEYLRRIGVV